MGNKPLMKAVQFDRFGSASETLKQTSLPIPEPKEDEVLVQLKTSGVNPSDVKKRNGAFPDLIHSGYIIPHSDGAGIIKSVGKRVDGSRIGERVFVYQAQHNRRFGTAAEYVALPSKRAAKLPDSVSFEVGACIGIPMMTAHRCVFSDGNVKNLNLLVTGGAGKVACYAIQLAKFAGAQVFATASNSHDANLCQNLGANHVFNHREDGWGKEVVSAARDQKIDRIIDCEFGKNLSEVLDCVKTSGVIATYGSALVSAPPIPFKDMMFKDLTIRMVLVYDMPESAKSRAVGDIQKLLSENQLHHRLTTFPLEDVHKAHEMIERGGKGCVVLKID